MSLYNIKSDPIPGSPFFIITKFTPDLEVESSYLVGHSTCNCPAGHRPSCRHRQMLSNLRQRANTAWFWDFTREAWVDPTGEASKPAPGDEPKLEVGLVPGTGLELIEVDEPISRREPLAPKADSQAGFRRRL